MSDIVAITGGTGFVGRHVIAALRREGFAVRALVRDPRKATGLDGIELVEGSLEHGDTLDTLCRGASAVVHCAGVLSAAKREEFEEVNVTGTARLVGAAVNCAVGRFVLLSSLAAREPTLSPYGASKRGGEHALRESGAALSWAILRPPAVYGPGDRGTLPLIRQFTRRLAVVPGSARGRFSLIYVEDLADAIVTMVRDGAPSGQIHELHDGTYGGYSWRELAHAASLANKRPVRCLFIPRPVASAVAHVVGIVAQSLGRATVVSPGKIAELYHSDWVCRNNLVDAATDWQAGSDFRTGFEATVGWYRAHGWL